MARGTFELDSAGRPHERIIDPLAGETAARLDAIEDKLDRVLAFTGRLETLLAAYLGGGAKGVIGALIKSRSGVR